MAIDARYGDEIVSEDPQYLNRRQLLRQGLSGVSNAGIELIERRANQKAKGWIRPPFAQAELDFLLACTRCDACIEACPHQVIFPLPVRRGAEVALTPALDLLNKGCHLCAEWPCVEACVPNALKYPPVVEGEIDAEINAEPNEITDHSPEVQQSRVLPTALARAEIDTNMCLPYNGPECGACRGSCPVPNALQWQNEKPTIDAETCVGCAMCREACILEPKAIILST